MLSQPYAPSQLRGFQQMKNSKLIILAAAVLVTAAWVYHSVDTAEKPITIVYGPNTLINPCININGGIDKSCQWRMEVRALAESGHPDEAISLFCQKPNSAIGCVKSWD